MSKSTFQSGCRLVVGVVVVALVTHTWLVMGLIVPVTVAGNSMSPTLCGPHRNYRCEICQLVFANGVDELPADRTAVCPHCHKWSARAISDLLRGDRLLIDRTAFALRQPRRWEVVVFRSPEDPSELCVKRIVGLPGEAVSLTDGEIRINGKQISQPAGVKGVKYEFRYADNPKVREVSRLGPAEYFVLGDNAAISEDSRNWPTGPALDDKLLIGKPLGVR